jgi:hypothetical protein
MSERRIAGQFGCKGHLNPRRMNEALADNLLARADLLRGAEDGWVILGDVRFNDGSTALFAATLLYSLIPKATEMDLAKPNIQRTEKINGNLQVSC